MNEKNETNIALKIVGILLIIPVIGYLLKMLIYGIAKLIDWIKFKIKIKKGLKDGTIIKVGNEYFRVGTEPESNIFESEFDEKESE